jgi:prepilin-type processing-associated H-X9-DG protein
MPTLGGGNWSPDSGFNFWPDWGPSIASYEGGAPQQYANPQPLFILLPKDGCSDPNQGGCGTGGCGDGNLASSPHSGGINVAMGDGSVHFATAGISIGTWSALFTPRSGEVLGTDWTP